MSNISCDTVEPLKSLTKSANSFKVSKLSGALLIKLAISVLTYAFTLLISLTVSLLNVDILLSKLLSKLVNLVLTLTTASLLVSSSVLTLVVKLVSELVLVDVHNGQRGPVADLLGDRAREQVGVDTEHLRMLNLTS